MSQQLDFEQQEFNITQRLNELNSIIQEQIEIISSSAFKSNAFRKKEIPKAQQKIASSQFEAQTLNNILASLKTSQAEIEFKNPLTSIDNDVNFDMNKTTVKTDNTLRNALLLGGALLLLG